MKIRGFTLIELVAVLAIIAIMVSMVIPSMAKLYARSEATTSINWIITAVNFTRHAAISFRTTATLCPKKPDHFTCGGHWHEDLMIFADRNEDGKFNQDDYLIHQISSQKVTGTFKWRSFRNRQFLQLTRFGYTNYQNGNFVYCPAGKNSKLARQIVINVQGRARTVNTRNQDGIPIDRKGKPLKC